jgi:hypothetical protein
MSWEQLGCKSRSLARFPNRDMYIKSSQLYIGENATFHGRSALGTFYLNVWGGRGEEHSPVEKKLYEKHQSARQRVVTYATAAMANFPPIYT